MLKRILTGLGLLALCMAAIFFWAWWSVPEVELLRKQNPRETALMRQRDEEARKKGRHARRFQVWVPVGAMAGVLKTAVLIGEDDAFFQHQGIDYEQIKQSFIKNWEEKSFVRGGSTITQQLAKNLYLSTSKNPLRKLREFFIARQLESELGKRRILEIYLNVIEWGEGIYGAQAAALTYFHKSAQDLSLKEAVQLAAMIPNPRRWSPLRPTQRFVLRTNILLERMHQYHHISDAQYEQALEKEPSGQEESEIMGPGPEDEPSTKPAAPTKPSPTEF
jgi:monofunctional biosynthetic peptidoglycan transglycosylase